MSINNNSNFGGSYTPNSVIVKMLWRQQQDLINKHPDGVTLVINEEDPLDIQANIEGPKGTPYEGGIFRIKLIFTQDFPQVAPKGFFITKIYHPNVSDKGEICVNTLKRDWDSKVWSLYNMLEVIKCLLIVPFPESSLNQEAGKLFMEDYEKYFKIATIFTSVHAIPKDNITNNRNIMSTVENENFKSVHQFPCSPNQSNNRFMCDNKNFNNILEEGSVTPKNENISAFNYNLLRHSKPINVNSAQFLKSNNLFESSSIKLNKNETNVLSELEIKSCQKPNIKYLPYIMKDNSLNYTTANLENTNLISNTNFNNINNHNFFSPQNYNNVILNTQTPRTKRDEIKKWLSRI